MNCHQEEETYTLTKTELDDILDETEGLKEELSKLKNELEVLKLSNELDNHITICDCEKDSQKELYPVIISRDVWISFILTIKFNRSFRWFGLLEALELGSYPPNSLRLSSDEVELLNSYIERMFNREGLILVIYTIASTPNPNIISTSKPVILKSYRPVRGLNLTIEVEYYDNISVDDYPLYTARQQMNLLTPMDIIYKSYSTHLYSDYNWW